MKTLTTLAAALLAVVLTLAPTIAFAATTVTVSTDASSYSGAANIHVSGTISPTPSANTAVFITVKNGQGSAVDYNSAPVSTSNGAYSATFVAGSSAWTTGTYTVNASWGASSGVSPVFATTTFTYTSTGATGGGGGGNYVIVQVQATTPAWPGQTIQISVLTSSSVSGGLVDANFQTVHYHTPDGTLVTLGTPTTVHTGFYIWTVQLPNDASDGTYFVHAWVNNQGVQGQGLGAFTVNTNIASKASQDAITKAVSDLSTAIQGLNVGAITTAINAAKTSADNAANAVNGLASTVNGIQSTVNSINSAVGSISTAVQGLSGLSAQVASTNTAVSNSQTYVLVVAALAAITLVLELAILVRKLS